MAKDIHQLAEQLHLERVYVAGHDIGGMVAYAFARLYPETSRGVMMLDALLPGLGPWEDSKPVRSRGANVVDPSNNVSEPFPGSPLLLAPTYKGNPEPIDMFLMGTGVWSDGRPAPM